MNYTTVVHVKLFIVSYFVILEMMNLPRQRNRRLPLPVVLSVQLWTLLISATAGQHLPVCVSQARRKWDQHLWAQVWGQVLAY